MPIINLETKLDAYVKSAKTQYNTLTSASENHAKKLANFLVSPQGALFAAKQTALQPETAQQRLAAMLAQSSVGVLPGIHIPTNFSLKGAQQLPKYYHNHETKVNSKIDSSAFVSGDDLSELDIVPFYFTTYKLSSGQVEMGDSLAFRSFFSSIQDSVSGNWSSFNYTGRGEMFYVFNNRGRTVNMTFKVAAFNQDQLRVIHSKVKALKSFVAPTYNENGYMQGNFFKLTIGDYIKSTPGIITNVGVSVTNDVPWEVRSRQDILPHVLDVTVGFTVLEDKTPQALLNEDALLADELLDF